MSPCIWYKAGAGTPGGSFFACASAFARKFSAIGDLKSTGNYSCSKQSSRARIPASNATTKVVFERELEVSQDALFRCKDILTDGIACKAIESMKVKLLPSIITV